ncbi:uncharacterized protein LOC123513316 [Portunus trituberculatus]|uniref:uncharacterized protein LOC123513316 n=1 Tax=Portunus trituberculatus TaxID=210409 RepID=UPI001E1D1DCF|nr:uncharacterized protein LOC123513316 [Portunus trituberculatus]
MICTGTAFFLALLASATCQVYDTHQPFVQPAVVTQTVTVTTTVTQTIRVPVTSDVWVSSVTYHPVPATHLVTEYSYIPIDSTTVTSVIVVTSTPVSVVTQTSQVNPVRTAVSVFTSFLTDTETRRLYHTITHTAYYHELKTVPVHSVQTLVQRVTTTSHRYTTVTVTSTTFGYH